MVRGCKYVHVSDRFPKKSFNGVGGWMGDVGSIQVFFNVCNFAKPLARRYYNCKLQQCNTMVADIRKE